MKMFYAEAKLYKMNKVLSVVNNMNGFASSEELVYFFFLKRTKKLSICIMYLAIPHHLLIQKIFKASVFAM